MLLSRSVAHAVAATTLLLPLLSSAQNASTSLPIVDLGYELYRATTFNETRGYYNFSNIRYAAPPVGDLRFKAPVAPVMDRSVVNDGSVGRICPQGSSSSSSMSAFLAHYLETGQVSMAASSTSDSSTSFKRDPRETEDCLFLDVIVPKRVFESAGNGKGAPVLVWIYGGGYTTGSKTAERTPSGLIERSITSESDGVVYVAMNYRVGAFGWLSGPSFQEGGTANAGLHDQRFALQWVQHNIHLFGGDKDRVTVFGESAGGGSIVHQITAYGGLSKAPFQRAIPQSPAWFPMPSLSSQEKVFQGFLTAVNATSLEEARALSSEQLMDANVAMIAGSGSGISVFGPAIDGDFVPQDPKSLLRHGQYDMSVGVLVGHNANESLTMTPAVTNSTLVDLYVAAVLSTAPTAVVEYITTTLYPPVYDGADALYANPFERLALIIAEATIVCNAHAIAAASAGPSYAYLFGVYPSLHGQDVPNTYFDPGSALTSGDGGFAASLPFNQSIALVLQDYITSFAVTGVPGSALDGLSEFVEYGPDAALVGLRDGGIGVEPDAGANERCSWWAQNLLT